MAMNKISSCVSIDSMNVVWIEYGGDCLCNTLKADRENDKGILNIYKYVHY